MITEHDLQEAIAECKGTRNPNANTCLKLASYYTIFDHMFKEEDEKPSYSYANGPDTIQFNSSSEFAEITNGMTLQDVWPIIDELMTTLQVVNPRLFNSVIRKLKEG